MTQLPSPLSATREWEGGRDLRPPLKPSSRAARQPSSTPPAHRARAPLLRLRYPLDPAQPHADPPSVSLSASTPRPAAPSPLLRTRAAPHTLLSFARSSRTSSLAAEHPRLLLRPKPSTALQNPLPFGSLDTQHRAAPSLSLFLCLAAALQLPPFPCFS